MPGPQLSLPFGPPRSPATEPRAPRPTRDDGADLAERLAAKLRQPMRLVLTDNAHTMISSRTVDGLLTVRLHHMFLRGDDAVLAALARFLTRRDRRASSVLDAFIAEHGHRIREGRSPRVRLRTRGEHHDLREIFDEVNRQWFDDGVEAFVTWGRRARGRRRRRRSIRFGTYVAVDRLIRIHPALDQAWVPRFFVANVLFHEMLHAVMPAPVENGRSRFHDRAFRDRERAHPDYERVKRWESDHLDRLLRC